MSIEKLPINASLKQVMDKFEEISLTDFSNIDIVVKNELPSEVKNGQIVAISDSYNDIIFQADKNNYNFKENDIYIKLFDRINKHFVIGKSKKVSLYIFGVEKFINNRWERIDSYIGVDDVWVSMKKINLLESDKISEYQDNYSIVSTGASYTAKFNSDCFYAKMVTIPSSGSPAVEAYASTKELQPTSSFNKLCFNFKASGESYIRLVDSEGRSVVNTKVNASSNTYNEIDISNIDIDCYVRYIAQGLWGKTNGTIYIYDCWLE